VTLTWVRFGIAAIGMLIWAYGYQIDDETILWLGIGFLAVALLLRFAARRRPPQS
jgi:membrane protein implicated in regulation of membrane protease activity